MPTESYKCLRKIITILPVVMLLSVVAIAQLDNLREESKTYRDRGYQAQISGDLDTAMSYYQKAIQLDPLNAAAYNDLGVAYEFKGLKKKAEESYLKAVQIDPYSQGAYFNLANLYEEQGNLRQAASFWKRRIELGDPNDPWTQKAEKRLQNIGMLIEDIGHELQREETADLIKSLSRNKDYFSSKSFSEISERKKKARNFFISAKANYSKGNYQAALKDAGAAHFLDPTDVEIEKFMDSVREKLGIRDR